MLEILTQSIINALWRERERLNISAFGKIKNIVCSAGSGGDPKAAPEAKSSGVAFNVIDTQSPPYFVNTTRSMVWSNIWLSMSAILWSWRHMPRSIGPYMDGWCQFCELMDILAGVHCTWKNGDPCLQGSQPWRSSGEICSYVEHVRKMSSFFLSFSEITKFATLAIKRWDITNAESPNSTRSIRYQSIESIVDSNICQIKCSSPESNNTQGVSLWDSFSDVEFWVLVGLES